MGKSLAIFFLFTIGTALSMQAQNSAKVGTSSVAASQVQNTKRTQGKAAWLTALYLRPVEQSAMSRENWPLIPAQLLEVFSTHSIETPDGLKTVSKLKKGDILYRCETATQRVVAWEVRIVQRKSRRVDALYSAAMDGGAYPLERIVAVDR